jgi:hypothetical protein
MSCLKASLDEEDVSVRQLRRALLDALNEQGDSSVVFLHDLNTYDLLVIGVAARTRVSEMALQGMPYSKLRLAFERTSQPIDPDVTMRRLQSRDFISPTVFSVMTGGLLYFNMLLPAMAAGCFALSGLYNIYSIRAYARATERRNRRIGQALLQGFTGPHAPECQSQHCRYCDP